VHQLVHQLELKWRSLHDLVDSVDFDDYDCRVYRSGALFSRMLFENCARDVKKVILCLVTIFTGVGEFKCMMLVSVVTW